LERRLERRSIFLILGNSHMVMNTVAQKTASQYK